MGGGTDLAGCRRNVHSQTGEDGVIGAILDRLPGRDGWCVEFGAWDGRHLSNVCHLIESRGYQAVLIEADARRFATLQKNFAAHPGVHPRRALVGWGAEDGLDAVLAGTPIPADFDFLSVDIDGNDYHVWAAVRRYRPKVVCIEFNPTMPTALHYVQPADPRVAHGSSLAALDALARDKGYALVCVLDWNAFFVRADYFPAFGIADNRPAALRTSEKHVLQAFVGYDGRLMLAGKPHLWWHGVRFAPADIQVLPRWLRRYPPHYNAAQRAGLAAFKTWRKLRRAVFGKPR